MNHFVVHKSHHIRHPDNTCILDLYRFACIISSIGQSLPPTVPTVPATHSHKTYNHSCFWHQMSYQVVYDTIFLPTKITLRTITCSLQTIPCSLLTIPQSWQHAFRNSFFTIDFWCGNSGTGNLGGLPRVVIPRCAELMAFSVKPRWQRIFNEQ